MIHLHKDMWPEAERAMQIIGHAVTSFNSDYMITPAVAKELEDFLSFINSKKFYMQRKGTHIQDKIIVKQRPFEDDRHQDSVYREDSFPAKDGSHAL